MDLVPDAKHPLELVEADLDKPETWVEAVKSCRYVFHMASPFPNPSSRQPTEEELIRPAVDGTVSVLKACVEAGCVKRVILTSSIAAISCGQFGHPDKSVDYLYSEKDWSVESNCPPYEKSKLLAEKAAWDFMKKLEEDKVFELVVMNPGYVQGPFDNISSGAGSIVLCRDLLLGKYAVIPEVYFPVVDVRDVAAAHVAALEKPEAAGNRYVLVTETVSVKEVATILTGEFKPQGYTRIPSMKVPKAAMWVAKLFDPTAKALYPAVGKITKFNNEKMRGELGITPRSVRDTIIDTGYSLIEKGAVGKTARYLGHPSTRPPPPEPAATETPVATEEPAATETPVATEEPAATEAPVATETPEEPAATETPAATEMPVATEEPAATETPTED